MESSESYAPKDQDLYRHAIMIAECDEQPNYMLVLFGEQNADKAQIAMDHVKEKYDLPTDNVKETLPLTVGFWLPKVVCVVEPTGESQLHETAEAKWLKSLVKYGFITQAKHTKTMKELESSVCIHIERARVGELGSSLN